MILIFTTPLVSAKKEVTILDFPSLFLSDEDFKCFQNEEYISFHYVFMIMESCIWKPFPSISFHQDNSVFDLKEECKKSYFPLTCQSKSVENITIIRNQLKDVNDERV